MSIVVDQSRKRFGDFTALDDVSLDVPRRLADGAARTERQRQVDAAARHRRARGARRRRRRSSADEDATSPPPQRRDVGFVFQHYAAFKHMTVREERRLRPDDPQAAEGRDRGSASTSCCGSCSSTASPTATRRSSPAASGSAWRSPARWRSSRACCCSTSRSARSTRPCARSCAPGCAACTTRCTSRRCSSRTTRRRRWRSPSRSWCMNHGRIEQIGTPRELYEQPGQRVRDGLRRPGQPARRPLDPPARRGDPARARERRQRGDDRPDRPSRLRGAGRADARRRRAHLGADHARSGARSSSWARARSCGCGRPSCRPAQRRDHASGASVSRLTASGSRPLTTSASVVSSTTARMLARTAIQTVCRCSAAPG